MPQRLKCRFPARAKDGTIHEVLAYAGAINTSTLQGRSSKDGLMELRLASGGGRLNVLAKGRYKIVQTGEIIESDHPDAV